MKDPQPKPRELMISHNLSIRLREAKKQVMKKLWTHNHKDPEGTRKSNNMLKNIKMQKINQIIIMKRFLKLRSHQDQREIRQLTRAARSIIMVKNTMHKRHIINQRLERKTANTRRNLLKKELCIRRS